MKNGLLGIIALTCFFGTSSIFAANKTGKFNVQGNCDMCEKRIETSAKSLAGVSTAEWNKETKIMMVTYDPDKVSMNQIQTAITMAGHDTELFKANDEKYAKLPGCCQYKRSGSGETNNKAGACSGHEGKETGSCCKK